MESATLLFPGPSPHSSCPDLCYLKRGQPLYVHFIDGEYAGAATSFHIELHLGKTPALLHLWGRPLAPASLHPLRYVPFLGSKMGIMAEQLILGRPCSLGA